MKQYRLWMDERRTSSDGFEAIQVAVRRIRAGGVFTIDIWEDYGELVFTVALDDDIINVWDKKHKTDKPLYIFSFKEYHKEDNHERGR